MNTLTFPLVHYQHLLRLLMADGRRAVYLPVGLRRQHPEREWLVRDVWPAWPQTSFAPANAFFEAGLAADSSSLSNADEPTAAQGQLRLGWTARRGQVAAVVQVGAAVEAIGRLKLVGAGMHQLDIVPLLGEASLPALPVEASAPIHTYEERSLRRWSRTIGALGEPAVWRRLCALRVGIVGCGRAGSLMAVALARAGLSRLTLIDPDQVELHNLGEMDGVMEVDIGQSKAEAVADHLRFTLPHCRTDIHPIAASITTPQALERAKACDVLVCCVDDDAARLATAIVATLYHKVLVDIGVGVFAVVTPNPRTGETLSQTMGADVRLILPGDGCLLCRGNLSDYAAAIEGLCRRPYNGQNESDDWRRQRAGSLRSLNSVATAVATQMLQELVTGRARASAWCRIDQSASGELSLRYPSLSSISERVACPLCAKSGSGDLYPEW